jgi:intracellular multiplication protein IcmV
MALKDVVKVGRKTFLDPRAWLGYDTVKQQTQLVWSIVKQFFGAADTAPVKPETFEEAQARLSLTDDEIKIAGDNYFFITLIFLGVAFVVFGFSLYLVFTGSFFGFLIGIALSAFLVGQAFRNHFLYFQIKNRKLGCTYEEWRRGMNNKKDTSA